MTQQTKYNTTGLTRYFEALTQSRYNPKINASNELLRKRQEFCFGIKKEKRKDERVYEMHLHGKTSRTFLSGLLFIFYFFSIPLILCLCLSTEITLTIQIINCFSLVFFFFMIYS